MGSLNQGRRASPDAAVIEAAYSGVDLGSKVADYASGTPSQAGNRTASTSGASATVRPLGRGCHRHLLARRGGIEEFAQLRSGMLG